MDDPEDIDPALIRKINWRRLQRLLERAEKIGNIALAAKCFAIAARMAAFEHEQGLDTRAPSPSGPVNPQLAPVGEVHRTQIGQR